MPHAIHPANTMSHTRLVFSVIIDANIWSERLARREFAMNGA